MPSALALTILASSLTTVADWAGWHYVWRHEKIEGQNTPRKHRPSSIFISYYLPFMPTLAIILGPSILGLYNQMIAGAADQLCSALMDALQPAQREAQARQIANSQGPMGSANGANTNRFETTPKVPVCLPL